MKAPPAYLLAALLLFTVAVHLPSVTDEFVYDDAHTVRAMVGDGEDRRVHEMVGDKHPVFDLPTYFVSHYLRGVNASSRGYRPVTVLSYAMVFRLFGGQPEQDASARAHHVVNILLQACNTWLLYLLLLALCGRAMPALLGALVFAVHPIHTEAVAQIVGRGELLGFLFGAVATLLFWRGLPGGSEQTESKGSRLWLGLSSFMLLLAFCAKESAISWLVFLPLLTWARSLRMAKDQGEAHGINGRRLLRLASVYCLPPALIFTGLYYNAAVGLEPPYHPDVLGNPLYYEAAGVRVATGLSNWLYGLGKILAPFWLSCDYGPNVLPRQESITQPLPVIAALVLVALVVVGVRWASRWPLMFMAIAAFFGFSFMTSNVPFALETVFAERLFYTPSLLIAFLAAALAPQLWKRGSLRWPLVVAVVGWVSMASVKTAWRCIEWQSEESLFLADADRQPRSARLQMLAAEIYFKRSEAAQVPQQRQQLHERAVRYVEAALAADPRMPSALLRYGGVQVGRGDLDQAERIYKELLQSPWLDIGFKETRGDAERNLGTIQWHRGRLPQAERWLRQALHHDPGDVEAGQLLVRVLIQAGKLAESGDLLSRVQDRSGPHWQLLVGLHAHRSGRHKQAAAALSRALPNLAIGTAKFDDFMDLADSLLHLGLVADAERVVQQAVSFAPPPEASRARVKSLQDRIRRQKQ